MAQDTKLESSRPSGCQFDVCTKGKGHCLGCCLYDYGLCGVGSGFCKVKSANMATNSIVNEGVTASQQCHISKDSRNETMNWGCCDSHHLHLCGGFCTNPYIILQVCAIKDIGTTILSENFLDNCLNAAASSGPVPCSEASTSTANDRNEPTKTPFSGIITSRNAEGEEIEENIYVKIGVSVAAAIIFLIALYFVLCKGRRKRNEVTEIVGMEMGNQRAREDRNEETRAPATMPLANLARPVSTASSTFINPRRAPFPPPSSPPPDRPLPPIPRRESKHPPLVSAKRGDDGEIEESSQSPLVEGVSISPSSGPEAFGLSYIRR
ncbi:hypothetical protein GGR58DRAFT_500212 [Xylaria digitata]|nr:hypothetical protein GGR58DRAFT_500212 [Xylaria digitata]